MDIEFESQNSNPATWRKRSTLEKCEIVTIVLIVFVGVLHLVALLCFMCVFKRHAQNVFAEESHVE